MNLNPLAEIADYVVIAGVLLCLIIYLRYPNYFFQLPYDVYFFSVYRKGGVQITRTDFKTRQSKIIEKDILCSLLDVFNLAYKSTFNLDMPIQIIRSKDFSLIFENHEDLIYVVGSDKPSRLLIDCMRKFAREFKKLDAHTTRNEVVAIYQPKKITELVSRCFPFYLINHY